jgi:hypothetical protein
MMHYPRLFEDNWADRVARDTLLTGFRWEFQEEAPMLGVRTRLRFGLGMTVIALAGCSSSTSHNPALGPSSGQSQNTGPPVIPTHGTGGFVALINMYLPGTSDHSWSRLVESDGQPLPARDMVFAASLDAVFYVAFFNFSSVADAASFYANPPHSIKQFVDIALGYSPLNGSTGIGAPSKGLDFRSCNGEGTGASVLPSGECSDGTASFSIGAGMILQRGSVDVFLGYIGSTRDHGDPSDLARLTPYATSCLQLLDSVGLLPA